MLDGVQIDKKISKLKTVGNSMLPILKSGDIVYIKKTNLENIQVNDFIIIKRDTKYITHRLIYKSKSYVVTKGDNNLKADGRVPRKNIIGKLEKVQRGKIEFTPELFYLMQSSAYLKEIIKIKNILSKGKLDFLFLKGLPLHLYYEKKPPRRIYADCDLLVRKKDLQKIKKMMRENGYKIFDSSITKKKTQVLTEISFIKKIGTVLVNFDVHINPAFMMTQLDITEYVYSTKFLEQFTEACFKNIHTITIEKETYPILEPSYLIVYLSLHLFHHNFKGVFRLELIHKIIVSEFRQKLIWNEAQHIIDNFKLRAFVYPVFLLLKKYYRTQVPEEFLNYITPKELMQQKIGISKVNDEVFNDESRLIGGINRLFLLFVLSPNSILSKMSIIFHKEMWEHFFMIASNISSSVLFKTKQKFQQ